MTSRRRSRAERRALDSGRAREDDASRMRSRGRRRARERPEGTIERWWTWPCASRARLRSGTGASAYADGTSARGLSRGTAATRRTKTTVYNKSKG